MIVATINSDNNMECIRHKNIISLPEDDKKVLETVVETLNDAGYECFLVGGSVRDLVLKRSVYDYDFATNAHPKKVMKLFAKAIPTGIKHGTVTVIVDGMNFEITTYRADGKYVDGRRPETVTFSDTLEEDIIRRDFTINGLAYDILKDEVIDMVNGMDDIESEIIRTIGNPNERFSEDGLRTYRACRFAAKLGFIIEDRTFQGISSSLNVAEVISVERIREELMKIMESPKPSIGIENLRESGLLALCLPELNNCYEVDQNKYHIHDVYYHSLYSCDAGPLSSPLIRFSALIHDVGKVQTRAQGADGDYTFYNHEVVGARMVRKIMKRLKFSNEEISHANNLVLNHMFHYTDEWSDGAVRRFMRKVGVENLDDLFELRVADRVGNGSREGLPQPIHILQKRIAKIIDEENAITVKDLKINGNILMKSFDLKPGPIVGKVLNELLELVLDDPDVNEEDILLSKTSEILESLES